MPHHVPFQVRPFQRLVQARRQVALGELRERPREGRLAGNPVDPFPAAQPPQGGIDLQPLAQGTRRGQVEHGLRQEGQRQRGATQPGPA